MGFKLGTAKGLEATGGEIRKKLRFHREGGDPDVSVPGTPVIRKKLEPGILGEANMDGTIYISDQLQPGSFEEKQTINHEMRHATDIKLGVLEYSDDHVKYNGTTYARETRNGKDMILFDGQWVEVGDKGFPWEDDADNGHSII
jgi:hypothetical protein|tara:strand:+ start:34 stop:465 length:432 start_codon:yes stop_codon:yes gene_type:complete